MTHKEYLKTDQWKRLRERVRARDNDACVFCGAPYEAVHHTKYPKNWEDDSEKNCITVCKGCHDKCHYDKKPKADKNRLKKLFSEYVSLAMSMVNDIEPGTEDSIQHHVIAKLLMAVSDINETLERVYNRKKNAKK